MYFNFFINAIIICKVIYKYILHFRQKERGDLGIVMKRIGAIRTLFWKRPTRLARQLQKRSAHCSAQPNNNGKNAADFNKARDI